jgi:hypothetical protein
MLVRVTGGVLAAVVLLTCGRAAEPIALKQEVSRAISPGETHVFETPAVAGQFLRFTLDASHTRLKATLRRPDGRAAIVLSDGRSMNPRCPSPGSRMLPGPSR